MPSMVQIGSLLELKRTHTYKEFQRYTDFYKIHTITMELVMIIVSSVHSSYQKSRNAVPNDCLRSFDSNKVATNLRNSTFLPT